jgi:hypothetical protein
VRSHADQVIGGSGNSAVCCLTRGRAPGLEQRHKYGSRDWPAVPRPIWGGSSLGIASVWNRISIAAQGSVVSACQLRRDFGELFRDRDVREVPVRLVMGAEAIAHQVSGVHQEPKIIWLQLHATS